MPDCSLLLSLLPIFSRPSIQQASYAASSFSSVSYCVQQTKVAFTPEDSSATQGISVSVSNSFLSRHGTLPVPSVSAPSALCSAPGGYHLPFVACALRCVCRCSALTLPSADPCTDGVGYTGMGLCAGGLCEWEGVQVWGGWWRPHLQPYHSGIACRDVLAFLFRPPLGQPDTCPVAKREYSSQRKQSPGEQALPGHERVGVGGPCQLLLCNKLPQNAVTSDSSDHFP